jgi:hypothetical protein
MFLMMACGLDLKKKKDLKGKNAGLQKKKCEDFASVDSFGRYEK